MLRKRICEDERKFPLRSRIREGLSPFALCSILFELQQKRGTAWGEITTSALVVFLFLNHTTAKERGVNCFPKMAAPVCIPFLGPFLQCGIHLLHAEVGYVSPP